MTVCVGLVMLCVGLVTVDDTVLQTGDKNYKRLTCSQPVGLRHAGYIICVENVIKVCRHFVT